MDRTTFVAQQAAPAAAARPCGSWLVLGGYQTMAMNAAAATASFGSHEFATDIRTKRPSRHLGGLPT